MLEQPEAGDVFDEHNGVVEEDEDLWCLVIGLFMALNNGEYSRFSAGSTLILEIRLHFELGCLELDKAGGG
jgi:hypothetical protein